MTALWKDRIWAQEFHTLIYYLEIINYCDPRASWEKGIDLWALIREACAVYIPISSRITINLLLEQITLDHQTQIANLHFSEKLNSKALHRCCGGAEGRGGYQNHGMYQENARVYGLTPFLLLGDDHPTGIQWNLFPLTSEEVGLCPAAHTRVLDTKNKECIQPCWQSQQRCSRMN